MTIRIVVADDHAIVREGLSAVLATSPRYELVDAVGTGAEAVRACVREHPDVLILDIQLPGPSGIETAAHVRRAAPGVAILVLTMFEDAESVFAAMRAGALGYVLKGAPSADLLRAIDSVAAGEAIFGPTIARQTLQWLKSADAVATMLPELTPREREVLSLIATGLTNSAISFRLGLAANTVSNHISNIFAKLRVRDRQEAIARARAIGLGG